MAINTNDFIASEGQESGSGLAGWCWLKVFYEVVIQVLARAAIR